MKRSRSSFTGYLGCLHALCTGLVRCRVAVLFSFAFLLLGIPPAYSQNPKRTSPQMEAMLAQQGFCNGERSKQFERTQPGVGMIFRIYGWWGEEGNMAVYDEGSFLIEKYQGGSFVPVPLTDGAKAVEDYFNSVTNWEEVSGTNGLWKYAEYVATAAQFDYSAVSPVYYRISNKRNVFHLAIAYGTGPSTVTTQFELFTREQEYDVPPVVQVSYQGEQQGVFVPLDDAITSLTFCTSEEIEVTAALRELGEEDKFDYLWTFSSSEIGIVQEESVQHTMKIKPMSLDPLPNDTLKVKRYGICDLTDERAFVVEVIPPPLVAIEMPDLLCEEGSTDVTATGLATAETISWRLQWHGAAPGDYEELAGLQNIPTGGSDRITQPINFEYKSAGGGTPTTKIVHQLQLLAKRGQCEARTTWSVSMYPPVKAPVIVVTPADPSLDPTQPQCTPFQISQMRDTENPSNTAFKYLWKYGNGTSYDEAPQNIALVTNLPEPESINVTLQIDPGHPSCAKEASFPITLNPVTAPISYVTLNPENGCSPNNITLIDNTDASLVSSRNWEYSYKGTTTTWGSGGANETINDFWFDDYDPSATPPIVTLTLENRWGCVMKREHTLNLFQSAHVDPLTFTQSSDCSPAVVEVTASGLQFCNGYKWRVREQGATDFLPGFDITGTIPVGTPSVTQEFTLTNSTDADKRYEILFYGYTPHSQCETMEMVEVVVRPALKARLDFLEQKVCPDRTGRAILRVKNLSDVPPATTFNWTLNDNPVTPGGADPDFEIEAQNLDTENSIPAKVVLNLTFGTCTSSAQVDYTIYPRVDPQISATYSEELGGTQLPLNDGAAYCAPLHASFTGSGAPILRWRLLRDGGDGIAISEPTFSRSLENKTNNASTYTLYLVAENKEQCKDSVASNYIVNPGVTADFSPVILEACNPMEVELKPYISGGGLTPPVWDYGGGVKKAGTDNVYIYSTPGTAVITLTQGNSFGCGQDPVSKSITVPDPVVAQIDPNVVPGISVCAPAEVTFNNTSTGATGFTWDFGDGTPSEYSETTGNYTHTYTNTEDNPVVRRLKLTARNALGCEHMPQSVATLDITVYPRISVNPQYEIENACNPLTLRADARSSKGADKFVWTFTPDDPSAGATVTETMPPGTSAARYTLTNSSQQKFVTYAVSVVGSKTWAGGMECSSPPQAAPPVKVPPRHEVTFSVSSNDVCSGEQLVFTDGGAPTGVYSYTWNFKDGNTMQSESGSPVHHQIVNTSDEPKIYEVEVTSRQNQVTADCPFSQTIPVTVYPEVVAAFKYNTDDARRCQYPFPLTFSNESRCANPAIYSTSFRWDYGYDWNGAREEEVRTSKAEHERLFYNANKNSRATYEVRLTVEQRYGTGKTCRDDVSHPVQIRPELLPAFDVTPDAECAPMEVTIVNRSSGLEDMEFSWSLGDGNDRTTTSVSEQLRHTYENSSDLQQSYKLRLVVKDADRCEKEVEKTVQVLPGVVASFNLNTPDGLCTPFRMEVVNTSRNAHQYEWDAPGIPTMPVSTTDLQPFEVTVENASPQAVSYTVRLTAKAVFGSRTCEDVAERTIEAPPAIGASLTASKVRGCNPLQVAFTSTMSGGATAHWDFDNGAESVEPNPEVEFVNNDTENSRIFKVKLKGVKGECVVEEAVDIEVYPKVEAFFSAENMEGCAPLTVQVVNDRVSPAYDYEWQPGGGLPASTAEQPNEFVYENDTQNPPTVQENDLRLTVKLRVDPTCREEYSRTVTVNPRIYPDFDLNQDAGCSPFKPEVTNNTRHSGSSARYQWLENDVLVSQLREPAFVFETTDNVNSVAKTLKLVAESEEGCVGSVEKAITIYPLPLVKFHANGANEDCPPFDVEFINETVGASGMTFTYDFGDGTSETLADFSPITHTFENVTESDLPFNVSLVAVTPQGCRGESSTPITVFSGPKAGFSILPALESCSPFLAEFRDQAQNAQRYEWDFGDGNTSTSPAPMHQFENLTPNDQEFEITQRVFTANGCDDVHTEKITIWATPKADFDVNPPLQLYKTPGATVELTDRTNPTAPSWSYHWDFGDELTSTDHSPGSHTYKFWAPRDSAFAYNVQLVVKSPKCADSVVRKVFVLAPLPTTFFEALSYGGCSPFDIYFENSTEYADSMHWDFGDGTESTERSPSHRFVTPGLYHVKLTAWGEGGKSYAYRVIEVYRNPIANFEILPEQVMIPKAIVKANNLSIGGARYLWDFGDGATSTEESPVHKYQNAGEYDVSLHVESEHGCLADTIFSPGVVVLPGGKLRFPNVFAPNPSGPNGGIYDDYDVSNQVFHPIAEGVTHYKLYIFNRWGEQLFYSEDIKIGWDGYYNGKLCDVGVYGWRAVGQYYNGEIFDLRGNVTLMR